MDARALLETISEYVLVRNNAELHPEIFHKEESEVQLNAIASRLQKALDKA